MLGIGNLSRKIALFACRMSIANLTLLFCFGTATTFDTQGAGPQVFSIMSFFSNSAILFSTSVLILNGIWRNGCATGVSDLSTCKSS